MAKFHNLKIADIIKETDDCVSVSFDIPPELKEQYQYKSGQYITLKLNINGGEFRRSYSISSSPLAEKEFRIAIKKVKDGKVSTYLNEKINTGDTLEVMTPLGNFHTPLNAQNKAHYVAFVAGSGITPVISIIKSTLYAEDKSRFTLFYANKNNSSVIFKNQLGQLEKKYAGRFNIIYIYSREKTDEKLYSGRINPEKVYNLLHKYAGKEEKCQYFICGPEEMMNHILETLNRLKVERDRIHLEHFAVVTVENTDAFDSSAEKTGFKGISKAKIILDGVETEINVGVENVILDAALEAGLDVPYSCTGGMCCTCKAKLTEGKVNMDKNYALTDSEVKEGFILTCQSHPLTPKLVVDYDI